MNNGQFQLGNPGGPGRPPGSPNKISGTLKVSIDEHAEANFRAVLDRLAVDDPPAYVKFMLAYYGLQAAPPAGVNVNVLNAGGVSDTREWLAGLVGRGTGQEVQGPLPDGPVLPPGLRAGEEGP